MHSSVFLDDIVCQLPILIAHRRSCYYCHILSDSTLFKKGLMWCYQWKTFAYSQINFLLGPNNYYNKFEWIVSFSHAYSSKSGKSGKIAPLQGGKMVDRSKVWAKGGDGGNGCWSVHRSRTDWRGKPDGGNGGKGGNVILECSSAVWDFSNLQHHLNAKRGGQGMSKKMAGRCGSDQVVQVPVGTVIHLVSGEIPSLILNTSKTDLQPWELSDDVGEVEKSKCDKPLTDILDWEKKLDAEQKLHTENSKKYQASKSTNIYEHEIIMKPENDISHSSESDGENTSLEDANDGDGLTETELEEEAVKYSVAELTESGQRMLIASGGEGGLGNAYFGKSPKHKKFKYREKKPGVENMDDGTETSLSGSLGSESVLILELKSIADVGLVGMPNAGKSTLLGSISKAKPQVGNYAFTTLRPNIGKLNYNDFFSVTVADIPGIIKGAHENRGLGHAFLRHIERTKVLAYVVDLAAALDGRNGVPPWQQLRDLVMELEHYQEGLSERPSLVVANKIDENGAEVVYQELKRRVIGVPILPICAILEEGIPELKAAIRTLLMDNNEKHHTLKLDNIITVN